MHASFGLILRIEKQAREMAWGMAERGGSGKGGLQGALGNACLEKWLKKWLWK